jgi:hypothetical protein
MPTHLVRHDSTWKMFGIVFACTVHTELALEHTGTALCMCHPPAVANVLSVSWWLCVKHAACSRQMTVILVVLVGHQKAWQHIARLVL